ncbi:MAG: hypothetical protein RI897_2175 [Verrucomicrobiota bacterium]
MAPLTGAAVVGAVIWPEAELRAARLKSMPVVADALETSTVEPRSNEFWLLKNWGAKP